MLDKIKEIIAKMNEAGIPLPLIRLGGKPSFTGTMTFLSFNTALLGQLNKFANIVGDVDLTQANYLFLICLGAYLGRRLQDGKQPSLEEVSEVGQEGVDNKEEKK